MGTPSGLSDFEWLRIEDEEKFHCVGQELDGCGIQVPHRRADTLGITIINAIRRFGDFKNWR